jgi:hypothetical protein
MKKWVKMGSLVGLVIVMVLMSGCSSSQPTAISTVTTAPTTFQPPSNHDITQKGIDSAEKACIDNLPRDVPTDKCVLTSENKENMINVIVQNITEAEQHCQKVLPRAKDISLCKISDAKKTEIARNTAFCVQSFEPTTSKMMYCLGVQIYHSPWYKDYTLN